MDETSLVVNSGEYVTLCCKDSTAEPLSSGVVWMKDGVEISYSVRAFCAMCSSICKLVVQQVINRNGGLLLYNISKENSGRYQCIDPADNTTLLVYHVTVNANNNSTGNIGGENTIYPNRTFIKFSTLIEHSMMLNDISIYSVWDPMLDLIIVHAIFCFCFFRKTPIANRKQICRKLFY